MIVSGLDYRPGPAGKNHFGITFLRAATGHSDFGLMSRNLVRYFLGTKYLWSCVAPTTLWQSAQNRTRSEPSALVTPKTLPSGMIMV